jgi:hypothetical protein
LGGSRALRDPLDLAEEVVEAVLTAHVPPMSMPTTKLVSRRAGPPGAGALASSSD